MTLCHQTFEYLFGSKTANVVADALDDSLPIDAKHSLYLKTRQYAYRAATSLRDYRATYGLKLTTPSIFHAATLASFILLHDMQLNPSTSRSPSDSLPKRTTNSITDTQSAFEECFRCLLGGGLQLMLPRGIARMLYHTARQMRVQLPSIVLHMLRIVADTAWRPSDMDHLNSSYPNWAFAQDSDSFTSRDRMEDVLKKWENLEIQDKQVLSS